MDGDNPRIACGVLVNDRRTSVGRAVVDQNDLYVLERLRQNGVDALAELFLHTVNGDNNGYFGIHLRTPFQYDRQKRFDREKEVPPSLS